MGKKKTHKDVKLPFGSGKTDTRPWVPRGLAKGPSTEVNDNDRSYA